MTFINVEPYQLQDVDGSAPAGPRRQQPAPGDADHRPVGPDCRSRGSSWSTGTASSRARTRSRSPPPSSTPSCRSSAPAADRADRGDRDAPARSRPRGGRRPGTPSSVRYQTRTGCAVAWCSTRWPGGNWAPFSRSPIVELDRGADRVVRSVKPADVGQARGIDPDDDADHRAARRAAVRVADGRAAEQERGAPRSATTTTTEGERRTGCGFAVHEGRQPPEAVPAVRQRRSPCCRARTAASRRRSAGRSASLARRSAGPAARATRSG